MIWCHNGRGMEAPVAAALGKLSTTAITGALADRDLIIEAIVENDAKWAYKFQRAFTKKLEDPDDIYLEVRDSEQRRKRKGLRPRVVILPNWDMSDEDRYDEQQSARGKSAKARRRRMNRKPSKKVGSTAREFARSAASKSRGRRP